MKSKYTLYTAVALVVANMVGTGAAALPYTPFILDTMSQPERKVNLTHLPTDNYHIFLQEDVQIKYIFHLKKSPAEGGICDLSDSITKSYSRYGLQPLGDSFFFQQIAVRQSRL